MCKKRLIKDLTLWSFFSSADRAGLTNRDLVEQIQKVYVDALEEYENKKRVKGGCALAKYLLRLIDLRNISAEHSKMLTVLPIDELAMPSVVKDIYLQSDKWRSLSSEFWRTLGFSLERDFSV